MFSLFKKKKIEIGSPCKGKTISLKEVNDPTFAEEMMGKGVAVKPEENKIYSPVDGTITVAFPTLHALGLQTETGVEILLHVGIDTVNLKGEGFTSHVKQGEAVKKGDLLLEANLDTIKKAGYDDTIMVVITNTPSFRSIDPITSKEVNVKDTILELEK